MISALPSFFLRFAFVAIAIPTFAFAKEECASRDALKPHIGQYVLSSIWEDLPRTKDWSVIQLKSSKPLGVETIPAFAITSSAEVMARNTWHEGGTACLSVRSDGIWARSVNEPTRWQGPYTRLSTNPNSTLEQLLFERLFSNACYVSRSNEKWCFLPGGVQVGTRKYRATLMTDTVEVPEYGTAVRVEGDSMFWIFVPTANGWRVFRDTWVTDDNRVAINPRTSKPWRHLNEARTR